MKSKKEELSEFVESIFKRFTTPGLHICDLATGGGKSYTIGKLACGYYAEHFDRIIILCVQNKLIDGMKKELENFCGQSGSVKESDIMVVKRNEEVVKAALENGSLKELLDNMNYFLGELSNGNASTDNQKVVKNMESRYTAANKALKSLGTLVKAQNAGNGSGILKDETNKAENSLRYEIKSFFKAYRVYLQRNERKKNVSVSDVLKVFPELKKAYPQVECREKKVLLMTVDKAMYGIDTILKEPFSLADFADSKKKTLVLFDESDQAAVAMRNVIIDQSIGGVGERKWQKRYSKGYQSYLQYKDLIENEEVLSYEYHGQQLAESLQNARKATNYLWQKKFGDIMPYKNILPRDSDETEKFRRGVFFSGPTFMLNLNGSTKNKENSYICFKEGDKHFSLVHSKDEEELKKEFKKLIPLDKFLHLVNRLLSVIKQRLRDVTVKTYKKSKEAFYDDVKDKDKYLGFPTLDGEIHTLLSRFETSSEKMIEEQLMDFITNRKNLSFEIDGKTLKLPDYSIYAQGVQLYQEELDEQDNLHRVRLSCREIGTTPEKIRYDLAVSGNTSVVLCSATASSHSVISNFDIEYLKEVLGDKIHLLSEEDSRRFGELSRMTYPAEHKIEVIRMDKHEYEQPRKEKVYLPDKYRMMFSKEAIEDGLVDEWFRITRDEIFKNTKDGLNPTFQFNRIYQFIEAFHLFCNNPEVHSMLYFQNRSAARDERQFNVISCLIDGSYKEKPSPDFDSELPKDWKNDRLFLFMPNNPKDMEDRLAVLGSDKTAKVMMITAYESLKAGVNLQYDIASGLDCLKGDNWETDGNLKKDWDAIYLQTPTNYLTIENEMEETYEKGLYKVMLSLMMLFERGNIDRNTVVKYINSALATGNIMFNEETALIDKAAWVQTKVEQAVGRICRTRNKPKTTYILYDGSMEEYFLSSNLKKSLTQEFKALTDYISDNIQNCEQEENALEAKRCHDANEVQTLLDRMLRYALHYAPHPNANDYEDTDDYADNDDIPFEIRIHQIMNQSFKQTIIKKPVIDSLDELEESDKIFTKICKCYGDWSRNESNEYWFWYKMDGKKTVIVPERTAKSRQTPTPVSPSSVRLDVLMKNDVIRQHFERNGYATDWKPGKHILHPQILKDVYAGEIGEEAFRAIILEYTDCKECDFAHLEGKDYELADFVICNPDGSHKIAFDVKNMNPRKLHDDNAGDISTSEKRQVKEERLGCKVITVNMLQLSDNSIDGTEICGVIDENGCIIPSAIERIKHYVND